MEVFGENFTKLLIFSFLFKSCNTAYKKSKSKPMKPIQQGGDMILYGYDKLSD